MDAAAVKPFLPWLAAVFLSAGCGPFRTLATGAPEEEQSARLAVPVARREGRHDCGLSVLEMLARYYRVQIAPEDLEHLEEKARSERGVPGRVLEETLERNGFAAYVFAGDLLDRQTPRGITYHLERGRPLIVMLDVRGPGRHYTIVSGLDRGGDRVFLADPALGAVQCSRAAFLRMWEAAGRFTLLAVPSRGAGAAILEGG